jgi:hypothetical protein
MKKITSKEFLEMIRENPSVFEHWNTPLEITDYVDCQNSPITHLSKHLTFSGIENINGESATFHSCTNLKIATGTFHGYVSFVESSIEKIENLHVTKQDAVGWAANFYGCKELQIATGEYAGYVSFGNCGIHNIKELHIHNTNNEGTYAYFHDCPNLKNLKGWDLSKTIEIEPRKLTTEKERRALLKHQKENQLETLPFL